MDISLNKEQVAEALKDLGLSPQELFEMITSISTKYEYDAEVAELLVGDLVSRGYKSLLRPVKEILAD